MDFRKTIATLTLILTTIISKADSFWNAGVACPPWTSCETPQTPAISNANAGSFGMEFGMQFGTQNQKFQNKVLKAEAFAMASAFSKITPEVLEEEFKSWDQTLKERQELENRLIKLGFVIKPSARKADASLNGGKISDPLFHVRVMAQLPFDIITNKLYHKFNLSRDDIESLQNTVLDGKYEKEIRDSCTSALYNDECNSYAVYRTSNGRCNNLEHPLWGSAMSCHQRLLPANYEGNNEFRRSLNGEPLPNARKLSLNFHYHRDRPSNYINHMYPFFGQILDHDLTLTPSSRTGENQEPIECCPIQSESHPECAPILISEEDPFYSQFNITCMNFVRSAICPTCSMGWRQQMNLQSSFIDASLVYGNSDNETRSLRANDGTGDFRANQHTLIASIHTILLREHNRIAGILREMNQHWDGETIFQESRRILGAVMQVITYKEFLPITLGKEVMTNFGLWIGSSTRYDPSINPSTMIEFTAACFRFGHTIINSLMVNKNPMDYTSPQRLLRNEFYEPFDLYFGIIGPLVQGASNTPAQTFDRHTVEDLSNFLYRIAENATGEDLNALTLQRGRDNGLPTYVDMVRYCSKGKVVIRDFSDLETKGIMGPYQVLDLKRNYKFVQDIELYSGVLMELPMPGAIVGPTAGCVIGRQFHNLKYGDRFYFEHAYQAGEFTDEQLQELRKVTLSKILCLNSDANELPSNAMLFANSNNRFIDCKNVRGIDLSFWKHNPSGNTWKRKK